MKEGFRGTLTWDSESKTFKEKAKKEKPESHIIISDDLPEPVQSNATFEGKKFTSKSRLREHYRQHGFVETGGEHLKQRESAAQTAAEKEEEARRDKEIMEEAYMDVKYGRVEFTEAEKECHKREEKQWGSKAKVKNPY